MKQKLVSLAMMPLMLVSALSFASVQQPVYTAESVVAQESVAAVPVSFEHLQTTQEGISKYSNSLRVRGDKLFASSYHGITTLELSDDKLSYVGTSALPEEMQWYSATNIGADGKHLFFYHHYGYSSFVINDDSSLTPKVSQASIEEDFNVAEDTALIYSSSYSSEGYTYKFYQQNDSTGTLDHIAKYVTTQHISPVSYDAAKQVFLFFRVDDQTGRGTFSAATLREGSFTITDNLLFDDYYSYSFQSVVYDKTTGYLALTTWDNFYLLHVSDAGELTTLEQSAINQLTGFYNGKLALQGNHLLIFNDDNIAGFTVSANGLANKTSLSHRQLQLVALTDGRFAALAENGEVTVFQVTLTAINTAQTLSFRDYEFSWPGRNNYTTTKTVQLAGGFLLNSAEAALEVYQINDEGELSYKQSFSEGHYRLASKRLYKVNETAVIMIADTIFYLLRLNAESQLFEEISSGSVRGLLPDSQQNRYYIDHYGFANGTLYVFYNDRVSALRVTDTGLNLADTAADGIAGFTGLYGTRASVEHKNKLYAASRSTNTLYSLTMQKGKIVQTVVNSAFATDYSSSIFSHGDQLHIWYSNIIAVYAEQQPGVMQLLANNPKPTSNPQYLWEGFLLERQYNQVYIQKFDPVTGLIHHVDTLAVNEGVNSALHLNGYLYLSNSSSPATVNTYRINRAPRQTKPLGNLTLREGVETSVNLANYFVDDDDDTLSFNKISGSAVLSVSEAGVLKYNGNGKPKGDVAINVIDGRGLVTTLTITFDFNTAPFLKKEWVTPVMNQQQYFVLNLNDYIADPEGSALTFTGEVPSTMQLSAGGLLTGTPTQSGNETLQITVTDHSGATATMALEMVINAKPVVDGKLTYRFTTGDAFTVDLAQLFTDAEGQALTFTVSDLPTGLTLTESQLTGSADEGNYTVLVTATDSYGAATTAELELKVDGKSSGAFGFSALLLLMLAMFRQRRFQ